MTLLAPLQLIQLADAAMASRVMGGEVAPVSMGLIALASVACAAFLVNGGLHYMTSADRPERLEHAKKLIRNALIGLAVVLGAAALTAVLSHAYSGSGGAPAQHLPSLTAVKPAATPPNLVEVLVKTITGLLQAIIESIAAPFMGALQYFTSGTPLMAENASVFNLWLAVVAMADALFVLTVALLGFNVMGSAALGLDELEFKHLLPQLVLTFLLINSSIFAIDAIITLSNGMITALTTSFGGMSVWKSLSDVASQSGSLGIAALLIMVVFVILSVILLVYYVGRLVTLYLGAVLSPLVLLLWLLPSFKDFAASAAKTYLTTIFVLFVHVVILELAASIFATLIVSTNHTPDPIMALVVGIATLVVLLKTQGVLMQLSYASIGPKALRRLGGQFVNSVSYVTSRSSRGASSRVAREAT